MRWCLPLLAVASFSAQAQEHPYLSQFQVIPGFGEVVLNWTMNAGSTCSGTRILRGYSPDDLQVVGDVLGLCGSISEPVSYSWVDEHPPELSVLYYRLDLGLNGPSSVQRVEFDQLISSEQRFFPSPNDGSGTLLLRVPSNARVDLTVWSADGRSVLVKRSAIGQTHEVRLPPGFSGVFIYEAVVGERRFQGRSVAR
jgi:hypothetical protein